ncbi:MAG TPA: hypothetical protein VK586_08690, partial [Streptosporangiaceae bacterium]|nr:hypothetical protein [Streptosporangiaceae bacterium]
MATPKTTTSGGFAFISHHRRGLIALPGTVAGTFTAAAVLSDTTSSAPIPVALPSVADVQGIDPAQVTRQYPAPGATDVETEFFPLIEFAAPELPWMLPTPAATTTPTAGAGGPLPWLSLVVVQDRDGVTLTSRGQDLPDVLSIGGGAMPSEELPDPAQSALWAHAFAPATVSATGSQDPTVGGSPPGPTGSRLVAPRRLIPQTSYIACVVPTLAAAALAGLGHGDSEVAAALAAPQPNYAWSTSDQPVELPVYLHWEFTCGAGGDFETLARQLHELPLDASFGSRPLDLGLAGSGLPLTDSTTTFRGALTAPGLPAQPAWPDPGDAGQVAVDAGLATEIGQ